MKKTITTCSLIVSITALFGCANQNELAYHNMDNECYGKIERDYSVILGGDNGDMEPKTEVTCRPIEHEPMEGQREPSIKELKADKNRK